MQQLSVSNLVRYLKYKIDNDRNLQNLNVIGEISNLSLSVSGHLYFCLKDDQSSIDCVMFQNNVSKLGFRPKNGDKVIIKASASIYETQGRLQLYVTSIRLDGIGDLYQKYEELRIKLEKEGKFDPAHKIALEKYYPERIAVLTGDDSAAMSDIRRAFSRRWPLCQVDYYPVLVQGEKAAGDIIEKLNTVDPLAYDAIILARGGGSFEDLFCFNDEQLVNVIYDLKTFIVTGIGHEQDYSLADLAADLRAATPTAAVELITPHIDDVNEMLNDYEYELRKHMTSRMDREYLRYDFLMERFIAYRHHYEQLALKIDHSIDSIRTHLFHQITHHEDNIRSLTDSMRFKVNFKLNNEQLHLKRLNTLLEAYSSSNVLKRGYTLVIQNEHPVKRLKDLKKQEFTVRFSDGEISAKERGSDA
ncbi:MAG: exodeoxyribonuclease VII large subunit [Erysipelotrichaceae bacterium]|nr:exodeoxyribonuclease VII large subunit [Erysipelotrichaceae bacterium]